MSSFYAQFDKEIEHVINVEFPWYIDLIEECFKFKEWGFHKHYSGSVPNAMPIIVYESSQCRIRFTWEISTSYRDPEFMRIQYGRLHAPNDKDVIEWNNGKCYCWHDVRLALLFLDGLTPQEANKEGTPVLMRDYYEIAKNKGWRSAELQARLHASLWIHYKQRLFDIFDLRSPDVWNQYANYVKEYYGQFPIKASNSDRPPLYQIC